MSRTYRNKTYIVNKKQTWCSREMSSKIQKQFSTIHTCPQNLQRKRCIINIQRHANMEHNTQRNIKKLQCKKVKRQCDICYHSHSALKHEMKKIVQSEAYLDSILLRVGLLFPFSSYSGLPVEMVGCQLSRGKAPVVVTLGICEL